MITLANESRLAMISDISPLSFHLSPRMPPGALSLVSPRMLIVYRSNMVNAIRVHYLINCVRHSLGKYFHGANVVFQSVYVFIKAGDCFLVAAAVGY